MAFRWNKESLAVLRENAGVLTTEQIAGMLHTNITVVRNMAYRLKLSLRVSAYNQNVLNRYKHSIRLLNHLNLKEIDCKNWTDIQYGAIHCVCEIKK